MNLRISFLNDALPSCIFVLQIRKNAELPLCIVIIMY